MELDTVQPYCDPRTAGSWNWTPLEFGLLEQLMRNRGAALYRDTLYERVWGGEMADTQHAGICTSSGCAKKLGWQDHIETVYKVGYRLKREEDVP